MEKKDTNNNIEENIQENEAENNNIEEVNQEEENNNEVNDEVVEGENVEEDPQNEEEQQEEQEANEDPDNQEYVNDTYANEELYTGRKRKRTSLSHEKVQGDTLSFMNKLRECIEMDKINQKNHKPALEKLKILPNIQNFLYNCYYQKEFLDKDGLKLLQVWLMKNPDGTYPALNQLSTILDILNNLSLIQVDNLKNSQIGGYVMDLAKNMKYSRMIMKKANHLIQKWSRIVYRINIDYSDIESENMRYKEIFEQDKDNYDEEEEEDNEDEKKKNEDAPDIMKEYEIYNHAKIPKKGLFDFTKKPISNIDETKLDDGNKVKYNYFFDTKKKGRKKN